ncbi:MAG: GspE/PulE family protein [bacterium JZ-2024 1]
MKEKSKDKVATVAPAAPKTIQSGHRRLGDLLIEEGLLVPAQLEVALSEQKRTNELLGKVLVRLGFVSKRDIQRVIASQAGLSYVEASALIVDVGALRMVPESMARRHRLIPVGYQDGLLTVAVADPHDVLVVDTLRKEVRVQFVNRIATDEDQIEKILDMHYGGGATSFERMVEAAVESAIRGGHRTDEQDPPVVRIVNYLISEAIKNRATDIHIEPDEKSTRVRYRIDGILHPTVTLPKILHNGIVSRIKIMSGLDISETRLPQDGGASFAFVNRTIDLRVSTLPIRFGEKVVLRILDKESVSLSLDTLGFSPSFLKRYRELIQKPYGIILVTGPTGSGKTTTLYSTLLELNALELNVMTIEDPIEYRLSLINQAQVNEKAGFGFATALRSFLRQDPDVILVGEIRDRETAEMAVRAALTGHLVFSTLHTNDAPGAIPRLTDMGIPAYLLASSMLGVIAQRLVRRICSDCRQGYQASPEELILLGLGPDTRVTLYRGTGCEKCKGTGYRGRMVISELMMVTQRIREQLSKGTGVEHFKEIAIQEGMVPMYHDGIAKVRDGHTTLAEITRVVLPEERELKFQHLAEPQKTGLLEEVHIPSEEIPPGLPISPAPAGHERGEAGEPKEVGTREELDATSIFYPLFANLPALMGVGVLDQDLEVLQHAAVPPYPASELRELLDKTIKVIGGWENRPLEAWFTTSDRVLYIRTITETGHIAVAILNDPAGLPDTRNILEAFVRSRMVESGADEREIE